MVHIVKIILMGTILMLLAILESLRSTGLDDHRTVGSRFTSNDTGDLKNIQDSPVELNFKIDTFLKGKV